MARFSGISSHLDVANRHHSHLSHDASNPIFPSPVMPWWVFSRKGWSRPPRVFT